MEIRILKPDEVYQDLVTYLRESSLIPIVGSGLTVGVRTAYGIVPSGAEYKEFMLEKLLENPAFTQGEIAQLKNQDFSRICGYYEDDSHVPADVRFQYLKKNMYEAKFEGNDVRSDFFKIGWPYIYSLNIDDAIENSTDFNTSILPRRIVRDNIFNDGKCLVKLHGDIKEIVKYKDASKVFTSQEYARSIQEDAFLLNKLQNDLANQNILFIGCSLEDEMDLKSVSFIPTNFQEKQNLSRTLLFRKGHPGSLILSTYKEYGITDIVCFDNYDEMYQLLYKAWKESLEVQPSGLAAYTSIRKHFLAKENDSDKKENQVYFLWGKGIFSIQNSTLTYPYYFISRDLSGQIKDNLKRNKVHLVAGRRISGKTYLMADLYREVVDRTVYYLDSKCKISDRALDILLNEKNALVLIDVGAIDNEQFERIVEKARTINRNQSNFVVAVNENNSDTFGIVKLKIEHDDIQTDDIIQYSLSNMFSSRGRRSETDAVNSKYPFVGLPQYNAQRTLLDQVIYAGQKLSLPGKYSKVKIARDINIKGLALLIILATKESISTLQCFDYSLEHEILEAEKRYEPLIERVSVNGAEKDGNDMSQWKYVLNSKYWLRMELGRLASNRANHDKIAKAYSYIIQQILTCYPEKIGKQRKQYRDYISFDMMNEVFLSDKGGSLPVIMRVFSELNAALSLDYNFLHQYAKCRMNYSDIMKDEGDRLAQLDEARQLAILSQDMVESMIKKNPNDRLQISKAHVDYTIAAIDSRRCSLQDYKDKEAAQAAIHSVALAFQSPYNEDALQDKRRKYSSSIKKFIDDMSKRAETLPKEDAELLNEVYIKFYFRNNLGGNGKERKKHLK